MAANQATGGYRLTPLKEEIINGMNGLLEWKRRALTGRQLSPLYRYTASNHTLVNKLYSIAYSNYSLTDSVFNLVLPFNIDYFWAPDPSVPPALAALRASQQAVDTDFAGAVLPGALAKKYFAGSLMEEWGRFRFMFSSGPGWVTTTTSCGPMQPTRTFYNKLFGYSARV